MLAQSMSAQPTPPPGVGLNILFVEDHDDTALVVSKLLRACGHHVTLARTAADAQAAVDNDPQRQLNLLICDIGLPDQDGCDLLQDLLTKRPLPAIALTAFAYPADAKRCLAAGFHAHLPKPIDLERLLAAIADATR
jgi:CheY-like chemotaxis protein